MSTFSRRVYTHSLAITLPAVNYAEYHQLPSGQVALIGRVKYAPGLHFSRTAALTVITVGVTPTWRNNIT